MDERSEEILRETGEEPELPEEEEPVKPAWQRFKEGWYDKVPLTQRQLDMIIGLCLAGLAIVTG